MKKKLVLLAVVAIIFASCSTAYKTGQTPDDVYYVATKKVDDVVKNDDKKDDKKEDKYEDYTSSQEDQYLRMKVRNRYRWSTIDDYAYWNDSRYYGSYNYGYIYDWSCLERIEQSLLLSWL